MYPFPGRLRWLLAGRQAHLVAACRLRPEVLADPVVARRVESLRRWSRIQAAVLVLASLGVAGSALALGTRYLPALELADEAVNRIVAITGSLAGLLTLAALLLTRLLGQLEADLLARLVLEARRI